MNIKRPIREEEKQIIQFLLAKLNTNEAEYSISFPWSVAHRTPNVD